MTDWAHETRLLATPLGAPGSGRVRYGAAMQFHRAGRMGDAALEVYRVCSADDTADPGRLLSERGLPAPPATALPPEQAIRGLVEACDSYLSGLDGPGIAEARQGLADWGGGAVTLAPARNPLAARHLEDALAAARPRAAALADAIAAADPHLAWITYDDYDRAEIGADFACGHAFASLIGAEAPLYAPDFDLGLFLMAPHLLYRDHAHPAPELYVPLTGPHGWRFAPGAPLVVKPAHVPVWNEPEAPHLTKVGPEPFLCLYAWTRDAAMPARVVPSADWADLENLRLTKESA